MISRQDIQAQLTSINSQSVSPASPATVVVKGTYGDLNMTITAAEQLAATFTQIVYRTNSPHQLPSSRLQDVGAKLSERLHYLMEPVAPVEFDGDAAVVQMRSVPPSQDAPGTRSYFEILVKPQEISVRRFSASRGQARTATDMSLTHQICARLGSDLAAVHYDHTA
jgi:hypothetical protein